MKCAITSRTSPSAAGVAALTQNRALSAILFLYREVPGLRLDRIGGVERAKKSPRLPVVFTKEEARAVLSRPDGTKRLVASLPYGAGLRLMECVRLRVKDVDFARGQVTVREGEGGKDRNRDGLTALFQMAVKRPARLDFERLAGPQLAVAS